MPARVPEMFPSGGTAVQWAGFFDEVRSVSQDRWAERGVQAMRNRDTNMGLLRRGVTLVELMALIVVLGVLAGFSVPNYFKYTDTARASDTKATLGMARAAISSYHDSAAAANGSAGYPTLSQLETVGTVVPQAFPANPFNSSSDVQVATWVADAPPVSGTAGWNYDPSTGRFWANSDTADMHENEW